MRRREFVKKSAAALSLPFWLQNCEFFSSIDFPIHIQSDHMVGHLLLKSREWKTQEAEKTQTLIVGGGIAGISTAMTLGNSDYRLFELSNSFGGTSRSQLHNGLRISQGAHYELAYPEYYGEEVLSLFEKLDIIRYEPWKKMWSFTDHQHIIPFARRQQCYQNGKLRGEVITDGFEKSSFYNLLDEFKGEMPLPSRLIDRKHHYLNELTFLAFLNDRMSVSSEFVRQLDYHMMDDWGGTTSQVSALAGIHYFMCRPYTDESVDLFSPPEGNFYFLDRMSENIPNKNLFSNHLVSKVEKSGDEFEVEVIDVQNQLRKIYKAEEVIYAGQKHTLKYIYEKESALFENRQAPWMVINFIANQPVGKYGFWQNEYLGENQSFLGFIDSSVQSRDVLKDKRVLTAYYCLREEDRNYLTTIDANKERIVSETLSYMEEMLDEKLKIEACYINVMGHAMSIPVPGFLFNDANNQNTDLTYAGVDNGRLPLLFEAVDSGILAAKSVLNS